MQADVDSRVASLRGLIARALEPRDACTCRLGDGRVSFVSKSGSTIAEQHASLLARMPSSSRQPLMAMGAPLDRDTSKHAAAQFGGFLKLNGDGCISEAKLMLPNDSGKAIKLKERPAVAIGFTHTTPIALPQLIAFDSILQQASQRIESWLDLDLNPYSEPNSEPNSELASIPLTIHNIDIVGELLALERELKAARDEMMGGGDVMRLLESGRRGGCSPAIDAHHPLRTLPEHLLVDFGIIEAELCVYVLSLALDGASSGNTLVDNMIEAAGGAAMFRGTLKESKTKAHGKIMSQVSTPDAGIGYHLRRANLNLKADSHGAWSGSSSSSSSSSNSSSNSSSSSNSNSSSNRKDMADSLQIMTVVSFAQCRCKVSALVERLNAVEAALKSARHLRLDCQQMRVANAFI